MKGIRVAVTGASGFCGGAVAFAAAEAGARVVCLGRRPGPVGEQRQWDATTGAPDFADVDVVIHLAAAVGDPGGGKETERAFRAVNVDGGARVLAAAAGRPVVWVSSASVYDPRLVRTSIDESHPRCGQLSAYGRSKGAGDTLACEAGAVVLRPRAVYGAGDRHLLPRLRRAVRRGTVHLPGPDVLLSITGVGNLADACLQAVGWPPGPYNIADAQPAGRDALVADVLTATGTPVRIRHVPAGLARAAARAVRVKDCLLYGDYGAEPLLTAYAVDQLSHDQVLNTTKARRAGWSPRQTVADYLDELRQLR